MFIYQKVVDIPKYIKNINETTDIDAVDCDGNTMLHHYINNKNVIAVIYLLKKGVDPNIQDSNGKTALTLIILKWVKNADFENVIRMLMKCGADPSIRDDEGFSSYDYANEEGVLLF